jgi:hypothetical protein
LPTTVLPTEPLEFHSAVTEKAALDEHVAGVELPPPQEATSAQAVGMAKARIAERRSRMSASLCGCAANFAS